MKFSKVNTSKMILLAMVCLIIGIGGGTKAAAEKINWKMPAQEEGAAPVTGFRIYMAEAQLSATPDPLAMMSSMTKVAEVGPDVFVYDMGALVPGNMYLVAVCAYNDNGESRRRYVTYTASSPIEDKPVPEPPSMFQLTFGPEDSIDNAAQ